MSVTTEKFITAEATDIDDRITILLRAMSAANEMHLALAYPGFKPYEFGYDKGKKYSRIWVNNGTQTFVCFFVQRDNGDVWKAGGWKAPVLNFTRGNIMTTEGITEITLGRISPQGYWYHGM